MTKYLAVLAALATAGCSEVVSFECTGDPQCVIGTMKGVCVSGGCAFAASDCPSGLRYHASAANGGTCVPASNGADASVDSVRHE